MSQFAKLFEVVKKESADQISEEPIVKKKVRSKEKGSVTSRKQAPKILEIGNAGEASTRSENNNILQNTKNQVLTEKKAKQIGKSRDGDYTQVLTYIRRDTHRQIKKILIDDPDRRNLSDLVEELLKNWLNKSDKG